MTREAEPKLRFRNIFVIAGGLLVMLLLFMIDPDNRFIQNLPFGSYTIVELTVWLKGILYIGLLYFGRRALFDYIDMSEYFKRASETSEGCGQSLIALGLSMVAISIVILAAVIS